MRPRLRAGALAALALALGASAGGCELAADLDDWRLVEGPRPCQSTPECLGGQSCVFGYCRETCEDEQDCAVGTRCLRTDSGAACVNEVLAACDEPEDCPQGNDCADDGQCRAFCKPPERDCLDGQSCVNNDCVGDDDQRDPSGAQLRAGAGGSAGGEPGGAGG